MHVLVAPFMSMGLVVACSDPPQWETCQDAECRAATIEAQFAKNSPEVLGVVGALEDPIEQAALVEQLAHAYPQSRNQICNVVRTGSPAAERCHDMRLRPHLYVAAVSENAGKVTERGGAGPSGVLLPAPGIAPTWTSASESDARGDCGQVPSCLVELAKTHAKQGHVDLAGKACDLAWPEGSAARDECLFTVAEQVASSQGFAEIKVAAAMCERASRFQSNCMQHVFIEAAPVSTWPDNPDAAAIQAVTDASATIHKLWSGRTADIYADFLWSYWTKECFDGTDTLTGDLIAALPAEATRHVHAAAAWRVLEINGTGAGLERTAQFIKDALYAPVTGHGPQHPARVRDPEGRIQGTQPTTYWNGDRGDESSLPATYFIGAGRRTYVSDPLDDIRICVLEAAARHKPPPQPAFFYQVVADGYSEALRWTGARLGSATNPRSPPPNLSFDQSDLVRIYSSGRPPR